MSSRLFACVTSRRPTAFVFECGAGEHGKERTGDHGLADEPLERRFVRFLAVEIGRRGGVVELDRRLDQLLAIFPSLIGHVGGNLDIVIFRAEPLVFPYNADHANEVDNALELALRPDGVSQFNGIVGDRKSTRLNSSHTWISYAVFCLQ